MNDNNNLKILFIGDISARPGREAVKSALPDIRRKYQVDFVIANAENAAGGRGVTREILSELQSYGIDYFTTGEHVWDIPEFKIEIEDQSLPIVRPYNYEGREYLPGKGWDIIDLGEKGQIIIAAFLGQEFMRQKVRNPFWAYDEFQEEIKKRVGENSNIPILIDFHAEATSEKASFGWYVRNDTAAVLGTHTHVGTIDAKLLKRSTKEGNCAFVSDVGMCGTKEASLWVSFDSVIPNFKYPYKQKFKEETKGPKIFNSVLVEIENFSAKKITRIDKEME